MNKLTERLVLGGVALLVGLLLGWMVRGLLTYNPGLETVATYQDWRTACPPSSDAKARCQMVQQVLDSKSQSQVASVAISEDGGKQVMGLTLPYDVELEPGVGLVVGTDPVKVFPYRTCNQVGCVAVITLDDKLLKSLDTAKNARILVAGLDGKPVAIPLSLDGYADAVKAYHSDEAKRASWFWRLWS